MAKDESIALIPGGPEPPEKQVARQAEKRRKRAERVVPRTPEGEDAGDILSAWIAWQNGVGVPVPESVNARVGKQVRSLIATGYDSNEIKHGLAIWTVEQMDNDLLSPVALDRFVWRYARDTRAGVAEWRAEARRKVAEVNALSSRGNTKTEQRRAHNIQAANEWQQVQERAERQA